MVNESDKALLRLKEGNQRFTSGVISVENLPTLSKLKQLASNGQRPFAIILCCADSRTPTELLFDQGLGDLFVLRVAGNVVGPSIIASMEFAATKFETPLIVIMGHTKCGAIQSTIELVQNHQNAASKNLERLVSKIRPNVESCSANCTDQHQLIDNVTWKNVEQSKKSILHESQIISDLKKQKRIDIVCSVFDLDTGVVDFKKDQHLESVSELNILTKKTETKKVSNESFTH